MKKIIIVFFLFSSLISNRAFSQDAVVDINTFHSALDPYGRWIDDPQYGTVWISNEPGFRPYYTNGHWVYTDEGWAWVSDYSWGWAPFHYGRWAYMNGDWGWVPGYEWAPAWVAWSGDNDYYGWAPLAPGLSLDVSFGSIPSDRWCFVPSRYIYSTSLRTHFIDTRRNDEIYHHVSAINNMHVSGNIRYTAGPRREDVQRITHHTIQPRTINYSSKPGRTTVGNKGVNIYRPEMHKTSTSASHANIHPANNIHSGNTNIHHPAIVNHPAITNHRVTGNNNIHSSTVPKHNDQQHIQPVQHHNPQIQHQQHSQVQQQHQGIPHPIQQHPQEPMHQNIAPHPMMQQHGMPGGGGGGEHREGGGRRP